MSYARKTRRLARAYARRLGAIAGPLAVADYAGCGETDADGESCPATADQLLSTLGPRQVAWNEGAISAGAAEFDGCPAGYESDYYAAYEEAARADVVERAKAAPSPR